MPDIRPFRGLRYDERRSGPLGSVIAPPYDVISPDERRDLVERSPYNVVELELPEAGPAADRYEVAANRLSDWQTAGILVLDPQPRLSLYEQEFALDGRRVQRRGVIAAVALTDWSTGDVLPHEKTMSGPKEDRRQLLRATRTNISPVFGIYEDAAGDLRGALEKVASRTPDQAGVTPDGDVHRVWFLDDAGLIDVARRTLAGTPVVIADGHHRYETALEYRREREAVGAETAGDCFVLMVLVDLADPGLVVVPTHRVLRGLPPGALAERIADLGASFQVETLAEPDAAAALSRLDAAGPDRQAILLASPDAAYLLSRERPSAAADPLDLVDTAVLEATVIRPLLEPLYGANFPEHVTYVRSADVALKAVRTGQAGLACLIHPTPPAVVKTVAEAGARMPQKTTYFYPKLSTGIVLRHLDLAAEPA